MLKNLIVGFFAECGVAWLAAPTKQGDDVLEITGLRAPLASSSGARRPGRRVGIAQRRGKAFPARDGYRGFVLPDREQT